VSKLDAEQKRLVTAAIKQWVDDADEGVAGKLMAKYTAELDQTRVPWTGNTAADAENSYIRIDGPSVWIEFLTTRSQSTADIHYHSVPRQEQRPTTAART